MRKALYQVMSNYIIKSTIPQKETYPKPVFIKKREGGYAYIGAAGCWDAWVAENG